MKHDVTICKYPGDNKMRKHNKLSKKQRTSKIQKIMVENSDGTMSVRSRGRPENQQRVVDRVAQDM